MDLSVQAFTEKDAMGICEWRYPKPYDIYHTPDWSTVQTENWGMADEGKRRNEFHSVYSGDTYIGFFRLVEKENHSTLGLGLCPDFCGRGLGRQVMKLILNTAKSQYGSLIIRLEVRAFNVRAIKCFQNAGFTAVGSCSRSTPRGAGDFMLMELRTI